LKNLYIDICSQANIGIGDIYDSNSAIEICNLLQKLNLKQKELKENCKKKKEIQNIIDEIFKIKLKLKDWVLKDENTQDKCVICYVKNREVIFAPCGHKCCCLNDAITLQNHNKLCPICRNIFECFITNIYV